MLTAALIVVAVLGSWEWGAREQGFTPHLLDNPQSWALHRAKVEPETAVIIGSSQALADFDPVLLSQALGREVLQLSISAASVLPQLERLADDETVRGLVIADVSPRTMFDRRRRREKKAYSVLDAYEQAQVSPAKAIDAKLNGLFDEAFVFRNPALAPNRVSLLWGKKWPRRQSVTIDHNRRRYYDYNHTNLRKRLRSNKRNSRADRPGNSVDQARIIARVRSAVAKIQERGGTVVLVRLPISGHMARFESKYFPRARFWDRLVQSAGALSIHFKDHASLRDFRPPDGLHLDFRQAGKFTATFGTVLLNKLRAAQKQKKQKGRKKKKRKRRRADAQGGPRRRTHTESLAQGSDRPAASPPRSTLPAKTPPSARPAPAPTAPTTPRAPAPTATGPSRTGPSSMAPPRVPTRLRLPTRPRGTPGRRPKMRGPGRSTIVDERSAGAP